MRWEDWVKRGLQGLRREREMGRLGEKRFRGIEKGERDGKTG